MSVRDDQLDTLKVGGKDYDFYRIADLPGIDHLPVSYTHLTLPTTPYV